MNEDWSIGRIILYLIDLHDFPQTWVIFTQQVSSAVQERMPDSAQLFVTTTDNSAPARITVDALAGSTVFGCKGYLLSLAIHSDVLSQSASGKKYKAFWAR